MTTHRPPAIHVDRLKKTYSGLFGRSPVEALRGLSLDVREGEIFGLLGPNGAGKTTLIKVLLGLVRPTAGAASMFGQPVGRPEARRRVGYLPEGHRFPEFLTAREMLDVYGQMAGVSSSSRPGRIDQLLELVDMRPWADTRLRKYSKGMMQRVGMAQALIHDPDLIFLDEPTDGVDPLGRRAIRDLLLYLREEGKTIFLNSHMLAEVEQVCSRIAILDHGLLRREGRVSDLTERRRVYSLHSTAVPEAMLARLAEQIEPDPSHPPSDDTFRYDIRVDDRRELNELLDALREAGVEIEAIESRRQSLEDVFVDVVRAAALPTAPGPSS